MNNVKNFSEAEISSKSIDKLQILRDLYQDTKRIRTGLISRLSRYVLNNPFPGSTRLLFSVSKIILPKLKKAEIVNSHHNFKVLTTPNDTGFSEKSIYYLGTFEPGILNLIEKSLMPGDVFIDIGARNGLISVFASSMVGAKGKVLAIEPDISKFDRLQKNVFINMCKNVFSYNIALGDKNSIDEPVYRTVVTFEDFLKRQNLKELRFVRFKARGKDLCILKSGEQVFFDLNPEIILFEGNSVTHSQEIYKYFKNNREYKVYKLEKGCHKISRLVEIKNHSDVITAGCLICILKDAITSLPDSMFVNP